MKDKLDHVVKQIFRFTYGKLPKGSGPTIRKKYGYFTPEDYYQASIASILKRGDKWLDIGCGRDIFPNNHRLARILTTRAKETVGVDPSPNILENEYLDRNYMGYADSVEEENYYNLVTLRMVAEHVTDPEALVEHIERVAARDAHVIVYTIYKWSPVPIITKFTPFWAHHAPKRFFWNVEERDTFPVAYKMNTKRQLNDFFLRRNFESLYFTYLDDCRTLAKYNVTLHGELLLRKFLNLFNLHYPELCILSIYKKK